MIEFLLFLILFVVNTFNIFPKKIETAPPDIKEAPSNSIIYDFDQVYGAPEEELPVVEY